MKRPADVQVEVDAATFTFLITLHTAAAPVSTEYFLADVDAGRYDGTSIFRIVNLHNQPRNHPSKIEVIQMGLRETDPTILPSLRHESTGSTGLRHRRGAVSLARFAPGAVYHSFFVCMRDEPGLDQGGSRHPDGLGFAVFGAVHEGFEALERFFINQARSAEYPQNPAVLQTVRRYRGGRGGSRN